MKIREYYEKEALFFKNHQWVMYFGDPWNRYWHGTRLSRILKMVEALAFKSLLDVGCAEGRYLRLVASVQKSEELYGVGLDIARNYLLKAKKEVAEGSWILGDSHRLPFRSDSFDLVLCSEVLEHLSNPDVAFMELVRVSRKYVLVSVAGENLFYCFARKLGLVKPEDPYASIGGGHIHEMTISEIVFRWASEAGCERLKSVVTCYFPVSFAKRYGMPSLFISLFRLIDRLLSRIPAIRQLGAVQIGLLEKLGAVN